MEISHYFRPVAHKLIVVLLPDLICVLVCVVAAVSDIRRFRISNWLTLPAAIAGLALNALLPGLIGHSGGMFPGFVAALSGMLFLFVVFLLLGAIGFVGMGDVKLMGAVGAFLRWPLSIWALAYVAISGGVIALVYALFRGRIGAVLTNLLRVAGRWVGRRADDVRLHRIPYGVPILVGVCWTVLARYVPQVRFP